ncbi:hypothetical protein GCM10027074_66400 [Streptomyces deserti]
MAVDQLPAGVREFTNYLDGLLARLDQGAGWCAVFWQRDADGMQACLDGREVPPWDVVEALLQDLAAAYGPDVARPEKERARGLHAAALAAYDARPGGRDALGDRLDVMLREQKYAAERQAELGRLLASATTREEADALRLDLAWARDDHERATARCAELRARLADLDRRAHEAQRIRRTQHEPGPVGPTLRDDGGFPAQRTRPDAGRGPYGGESAGAVGEESRVYGGESPERGTRAYGGETPVGGTGSSYGGGSGAAGARSHGGEGPAGGTRAYGEAGPAGGVDPYGGGAGAQGTREYRGESPANGTRASRGETPAGRPGSYGAGSGAVAPNSYGGDSPANGTRAYGGETPARGSYGAGSGAAAPNSYGGDKPADATRAYGDEHGWFAERSVPEAASTGSADEASASRPAAPAPAPKQRKRRRGSARFAGMAEEDAGPVVVPPAAVPTLPAPAPAKGRTPRGARFAGAAETVEREEPPPVEGADAGDRREVVQAVETLARLRGEGRSGEAHALLVEAAYWPAARFPLLAAEMQRAGLGADWVTLLWEAASLPAGRLVAAADALDAAGRPADGQQILRQGVARPAREIGEAVLGLVAEGRRREVRALLDAYVRVRTPEEAARSAEPDPQQLVPLLVEAAQGVSDERHWDLVHALRVAGFTA